jgi:RimJ/RimL family protein N-acetyltransferase
MNNIRTYKCLNQQVFKSGDYKLVPIRHEDRYSIMQWRNEQIYHLRQAEPLTKEKQDTYFENVVAKLFDQEKPNQILFSFLQKGECIGYGGLVHINWIDRNAEISLVLNSSLERHYFVELWCVYSILIKRLAFKELELNKIFTYAFDIRPRLYEALEVSGFIEEARLKEHCKIGNEYKDVVFHSCFNPEKYLKLRIVNEDDVNLLFNWVNDPEVRKSALNSEVIQWENHREWFNKKLNSPDSKIYIAEGYNCIPLGQVRIEKAHDNWVIDYSVDKYFRGLGIGQKIVAEMISQNSGSNFIAEVKSENMPSQKVFEKLGFILEESSSRLKRYTFKK